MALPRVGTIIQRDDDTIEIQVLTDSFTRGQDVEVSGYLIQGSNAYAAFNVKQHIPFDSNEPRVLYVQLPAMGLNPEDDVTVVTRVAEVWPTTLAEDRDAQYLGKGLKAVWTSDYPAGK
jgi:hypothetical protein